MFAELWRRANLTDRLYLAYFLALGALIFVLRERVTNWPAFLAVHAFCVAVVVLLALLSPRFPTAHAWYPLVMPLLMFEEAAALNFLLVDHWQDGYLLALEAPLFPEPPTAWLGTFSSVAVTELMELGYISYFILLPVVAARLDRRRDKRPFFGVMAATALAYVLCYALFIAFPTEGPAHTLRHLHTAALRGGPLHGLVLLTQKAGVHGNAFPSAHAAGAIVALLFAWRYDRRVARWLAPLVILLCVGAVYDRYHYVSDVVAGIVLGGSAGWFILFAQSRPEWERRLNVSGPHERENATRPARARA